MLWKREKMAIEDKITLIIASLIGLLVVFIINLFALGIL
jgi:hypothetical protein